MTDYTHDANAHGPIGWLRGLDALLRGDATKTASLKRGEINVSPDGLTLLILALGALYGGCMGSYALFRPQGASLLQFVAAAGKVPLLFLLTLAVTFPSLYVFNALVGSRLKLSSVFRLIVAAMAVMLAVLASFGPIVAFFGASTTSYSFMLLLNVAVFCVAGFLGLRFLLSTLHKLSAAARELDAEHHNAEHHNATRPEGAATPPLSGVVSSDHAGGVAAPNASGGPLPPVPSGAHVVYAKSNAQAFQDDVTRVFRLWILVFGLVGAQMSWVLRPFLGAPGRSFTLFSPRESNFFEAVFHQLLRLLGGH